MHPSSLRRHLCQYPATAGSPGIIQVWHVLDHTSKNQLCAKQHCDSSVRPGGSAVGWEGLADSTVPMRIQQAIAAAPKQGSGAQIKDT
eukprot:347826-Chlamydomonas_euryale.AAC.1